MSDPDTERRSLSRGEWAAVILALAVVAAAAWVWFRKPSPPSTPTPAEQPAEAAPEKAPGAQQAPPPVSDQQARTQLEAVSDNPAFRRWLAEADDIVRRWAIVTDNLAQGVSPRKVLAPAGPKGLFRVVEQGGKTFIANGSYTRYDEFADAVGSVDAKAFAGVYRTLKPAIEYAYRALGYPEGSLDAATAQALRRIEGTPVVDEQVELVPEGAMYRFADPKLEGLTQVEKHLLRMGPRNTRTIQAKAREIREALSLPPEPASTR